MKHIASKMIRALCGITAMLVLATGIAFIPANALDNGIYLAAATPHYQHPTTGKIEDSGGEKSKVLGQSMTESALHNEALVVDTPVTEPSKPAETSKPQESSKPAQTSKPEESSKPTEPSKPQESSAPTEVSQTVSSTPESSVSSEASEQSKPEKTSEPSKNSEVSQKSEPTESSAASKAEEQHHLEIIKSLNPDYVLSPATLQNDLQPKYAAAGLPSLFLNLKSVEGRIRTPERKVLVFLF